MAKQDIEAKNLPGQSLLAWYNAQVGTLFCQTVQAEPMLHILDCTDLTVNLHNDRYEQSGVTTKNSKDGKCPPERGYKLATLRSLLDSGALLTSIAWGSIEQNDVAVPHDLLRTSPHLREGDMLLEDRGFVDGATISHLKSERSVDVCTGLKSNMNIFKAAVVQANAHPGNWQPHPTRKHQQIQRVSGLSSLWAELKVPLNIVVVRWQRQTNARVGVRGLCLHRSEFNRQANH